MTPQETSSRPSLGDTVVRYLKLLVEDTRLSLAEKLTRLLSALAVCAIVIILATVAVVFITIGVSVRSRLISARSGRCSSSPESMCFSSQPYSFSRVRWW